MPIKNLPLQADEILLDLVPMMCLNKTLTLGTSLFMYNNNKVHKMDAHCMPIADARLIM